MTVFAFCGHALIGSQPAPVIRVAGKCPYCAARLRPVKARAVKVRRFIYPVFDPDHGAGKGNIPVELCYAAR